jgi:hypothetical protein
MKGSSQKVRSSLEMTANKQTDKKTEKTTTITSRERRRLQARANQLRLFELFQLITVITNATGNFG